MDIDEIFEHIGELGRAQKNLLVLLSLPVAWMSFHVLIPNFIAADPGWNCFVFTTSQSISRVLPHQSRTQGSSLFVFHLSPQIAQ